MAGNNPSSPFYLRDILLAALAAGILGYFLFFVHTTPPPQAAGDIANDVRKALASCQNPGEGKEFCYTKYFRELTTETEWRHAFDVMHALQLQDPAARGCHLMAHAISQAETAKDPSKWRELMNSAPQDCSYGAAHGALEYHASTYAEGKLPASEIPTICDNPDTHNCTHALGHLLLVMNENRIPPSLASCETLPQGEAGRMECRTGVFMERITANNLVEHGLADESSLNWPARVPELEKLCREQSGLNSVACWKEIVHAVLAQVRNNPQKLVDFCQTAPGDKETRECIDHAIGIMAAGSNFDFNRNRAICEAKVKASDYKERCYTGLVASTLSTLPAEVPAARTFCASVEPEYRQSCTTMISNVQQTQGD